MQHHNPQYYVSRTLWYMFLHDYEYRNIEAIVQKRTNRLRIQIFPITGGFYFSIYQYIEAKETKQSH